MRLFNGNIQNTPQETMLHLLHFNNKVETYDPTIYELF